MDVGYIVKYGRLVPGREDKAFELFSETMTFWQEQLKKGAITYFEPFLFASGDSQRDLASSSSRAGGAGPRDPRHRGVSNPAHQGQLRRRAPPKEWLVVAEEVMTQIERSAKVATEFATVS